MSYCWKNRSVYLVKIWMVFSFQTQKKKHISRLKKQKTFFRQHFCQNLNSKIKLWIFKFFNNFIFRKKICTAPASSEYQCRFWIIRGWQHHYPTSAFCSSRAHTLAASQHATCCPCAGRSPTSKSWPHSKASGGGLRLGPFFRNNKKLKKRVWKNKNNKIWRLKRKIFWVFIFTNTFFEFC